MVKVRFAPSPTGYLHIGGARTALFNWMYARSQNGVFILRIEDTDLERSKQEFVDEILDSMKWLGLNWDELHFQSKRFDIYRQYAQKLLVEDKAYKDGEAVILKIPLQQIKIEDLIRGEIVFDSSTIKDQVLMKSDGSPTYSFACVVDDALMEITHVIRGEDHISNTPKQIMIYQALGMKPPKYAHLPLIMGEEGGRMSKRHGAVAVTDYKKEGFLPEAIVNYLLLLGWSPGGNQEVVDLLTAVPKFSIKKVNKTAAIFSMDKLRWINSQYIKKMETETLSQMLMPLMKEHGFVNGKFDEDNFKHIVGLFKPRMVTLNDFLDWAGFVFSDTITIDEDAKEHLSHDRSQEFKLLSERLSQLENFDVPTTEKIFRDLVGELGLKASDLVHPVRVALTGKGVGPGLFETMVVLGKQKTVQRLREAFQK
jgi:glutamyl-tRNA synthetase